MHVHGGDLKAAEPAVHPETQVPDPALLRPHRRRVREGPITCVVNKGYETITKDRIIDTILTGLIQVVPRPRVDRQQHQESVIDSRRCRLHIPTPHPTHHHPALRPFVS